MDFSLNCALNFVTKSPAAEKARSASTLVGRIVLNARSTRFKYSDLIPFAPIKPFLYLNVHGRQIFGTFFYLKSD